MSTSISVKFITTIIEDGYDRLVFYSSAKTTISGLHNIPQFSVQNFKCVCLLCETNIDLLPVGSNY